MKRPDVKIKYSTCRFMVLLEINYNRQYIKRFVVGGQLVVFQQRG